MSPRWSAGVLEDGRVDWPRALLIALTVAVVVAVAVTASTSTTAFDPYNDGWDGATDLRQQIEDDADVESELVLDSSQYATLEAEETVVFVIAPEARYSEEDAAQVREFVENGGTLVVFENVGEEGNELLADVGASARVDGRVLRDDRHNYRGPVMPVATGVENHTATTDVEQLTLNYASAVDPGPGNASVLVTTSDYARLGEDAGLAEFSTYPVVTVEDLGSGAVVVVGDPSIAINVMFSEPDNAAFLRGLYADHSYAALDLSHVADVPPLTATLLTVRGTPLLQVLIGTLAVATVGLLSSQRSTTVLARTRRQLRRRLWGRRPTQRPRVSALERDSGSPGRSDAQRVTFRQRSYPERSDDRIRRVTGDSNETERERSREE